MNVKNAIKPQHEIRRILTGVSRIDSIPNMNCFTRIRSWGFIRTGEHGVEKLIGNVLYLKKNGRVCQIETDGDGMNLEPAGGKGFETVGNGHYLMKQGVLCDGRGLILGPNSPLKNIPMLDIIL